MITERRLNPRYTVDFTVRLFLDSESGEVEHAVSAVNISQGGIQIRCSREVVSSLLGLDVYPPVCRLFFALGNDKAQMSIKARMVVNRRVAEDSHHLGFAFVGLDVKSQAKLSGYLAGL